MLLEALLLFGKTLSLSRPRGLVPQPTESAARWVGRELRERTLVADAISASQARARSALVALSLWPSLAFSRSSRL